MQQISQSQQFPPTQIESQPLQQPPPPSSTTQDDVQGKKRQKTKPNMVQQPQQQQQQQHQLGSTRRRAPTACDTCRTKKIKCDNVRPRCGSCVKNGIVDCHYRADDVSDFLTSNVASGTILSKLDMILNDLAILKSTRIAANDAKSSIGANTNYFNGEGGGESKRYNFDRCNWDMSLTSMLKWDYFMKASNTNLDFADQKTNSLLKKYGGLLISQKVGSFQEQVTMGERVDRLISKCASSLLNSYLTNFQPKLPVLDIGSLILTFELLSYLTKKNPKLTILKCVELLAAGDESKYPINKVHFEEMCQQLPLFVVVCAVGFLSTNVQLENFSKFGSSLEERKSVSLGCINERVLEELGLPKDRGLVSLYLLRYSEMIDNTFHIMDKFPCIKAELHLIRSGYFLLVALPMKAYSEILRACHQLMYYLEVKKKEDTPRAHDFIDRLFWSCLKIECEMRVELSPYVYISGITQSAKTAVFPKIPQSNQEDGYDSDSDPIFLGTNIQTSDDISHEGSPKHPSGDWNGDNDDLNKNRMVNSDDTEHVLIRQFIHKSRLIAAKYEDKYSWYFFLTEIAVRKVDNKLYDEIYTYEVANKQQLWDQPEFYEEKLWSVVIKYLNQYNGIINCLPSRIRGFLMQEVDVHQIHSNIKRRRNKKLSNQFDDELYLDEFLIDEDIILNAQSEAIIFIKTRFVVSKMTLFRPIIYMILQDRISLKELVDSAISVLHPPEAKKHQQQPQPGLAGYLSSHPSSTNAPGLASSVSFSPDSNSLQLEFMLNMDYLDEAPHEYQKHFIEEDFSSVIELKQGDEIVLKNLPMARFRILRVFIMHLLTIPKMTIPKISGHRHAGSWYYLRNLFVGSILNYLLYKKMTDMLTTYMQMRHVQMQQQYQQRKEFEDTTEGPELVTPPSSATGSTSTPTAPPPLELPTGVDLMSMMSGIISKDSVVNFLEHLIVVFEYWQEESRDCTIYIEYMRACLASL